MTALATMPGYSGAVVILFTDNFATASMHQHSVREDLADEALRELVRRRQVQRSPIIVPGG